MKLLVSGRWYEQRLPELRAEYPQIEIVSPATPEEQVAAVADADAVFGWISREAYLAARKLRWVQAGSAGVEFLWRIPELAASDVVVTNMRGAHAATIAEHAFAMLLCLTRGLHYFETERQKRSWQRPPVPLVGLSEMTLGVVGLGRIGTAIAQRGHGFDMRVIAVDANDVPRPDYIASFRLLDGLSDLLAESDVVAVATPITPQTRGMIGPAQLAVLKPAAYLLVVSRGGIVDERTLAGMLREGRLAGAGLDVTEREPLPPESELWDAPNTIITPHCSGSSRQTTEAVWALFKQNLALFVAGQPLVNEVDKRRGY